MIQRTGAIRGSGEYFHRSDLDLLAGVMFTDEPEARAFHARFLAQIDGTTHADQDLLCIFLRRGRRHRLGTMMYRPPAPPRIYLYHWSVAVYVHELCHWVVGPQHSHDAFFQHTLITLRAHASALLAKEGIHVS